MDQEIVSVTLNSLPWFTTTRGNLERSEFLLILYTDKVEHVGDINNFDVPDIDIPYTDYDLVTIASLFSDVPEATHNYSEYSDLLRIAKFMSFLQFKDVYFIRVARLNWLKPSVYKLCRGLSFDKYLQVIEPLINLDKLDFEFCKTPQQFRQDLSAILPRYEELSWNGYCIAGGILPVLYWKYINPEYKEYSDIDIFVYANAEQAIKEIIEYVLVNYTGVIFAVSAWKIDICAGDMPNNIQIIRNIASTAAGVIDTFDMDCIQAYFDGTHAYAAHTCVLSWASAHTRIIKKIHNSTSETRRIDKARLKGFNTAALYDRPPHNILPAIPPNIEDFTSMKKCFIPDNSRSNDAVNIAKFITHLDNHVNRWYDNEAPDDFRDANVSRNRCRPTIYIGRDILSSDINISVINFKSELYLRAEDYAKTHIRCVYPSNPGNINSYIWHVGGLYCLSYQDIIGNIFNNEMYVTGEQMHFLLVAEQAIISKIDRKNISIFKKDVVDNRLVGLYIPIAQYLRASKKITEMYKYLLYKKRSTCIPEHVIHGISNKWRFSAKLSLLYFIKCRGRVMFNIAAYDIDLIAFE